MRGLGSDAEPAPTLVSARCSELSLRSGSSHFHAIRPFIAFQTTFLLCCSDVFTGARGAERPKVAPLPELIPLFPLQSSYVFRDKTSAAGRPPSAVAPPPEAKTLFLLRLQAETFRHFVLPKLANIRTNAKAIGKKHKPSFFGRLFANRLATLRAS